MSQDRLESFFKFFGVTLEQIMELEDSVLINGGDPSVILIGAPRLTIHGRSGALEVLIKDDMKAGTVIIK